MSSSAATLPDSVEGVDLKGILLVLLDYKLLVVAITLVCSAAAIAFAFVATPIYRAEVLATDVRDQSMGPLSSVASQLGGLASIAGMNIGGGDENRREAQAVLGSRRLAEEFIKRYDLLPVLSAGAEAMPTLWQTVRKFRSNVLTIRDDARKGLTTVSMDWRDAAVAARWANDYVALANELLRTQAMDSAKRNVEYLTKQIAQTNVVEIQRVMYNLVENETKTLMLANARAEFAFKVIDPAVPPEIRLKPQRKIIVLLGTALGFVLAAAIALVHSRLRRTRRMTAAV